MRHVTPIDYSELRTRYDLLIGWGPAEVECARRFRYDLHKMDYLIDGLEKSTGTYLCNMQVHGPSILKRLTGKKICFIIFPNIEDAIIRQIREYCDGFDTIVYRLITHPDIVSSYSRDREDLLLMDLSKAIGAQKITYLDIGVCHPVIRNNTYGLYAQGNVEGVLVEPNPAMCALIAQYRPHNTLLQHGACPGEDRVLQYYASEHTPGANSFQAEWSAASSNTCALPLRNINTIVSENFESFPTILDIDTEGMDIALLTALDTNQYPIPIICAEALDRKEQMRALMQQKGYVHYISTFENDIFVRRGAL